MPDTAIDLDRAVFVKTALGQQEIQSRALGLNPMLRRLLILIDGKRSGQELTPMVGGQDLGALLDVLMLKGCVEQVKAAAPTPAAKPSPAPAAPAAPTTPATGVDLSALPAPETRTAKDVEMARNFMSNTVNTIFQPYTRLTLLEAIANCRTAQDARTVYLLWSETLSSSAIGLKRLPEFREKLFNVL